MFHYVNKMLDSFIYSILSIYSTNIAPSPAKLIQFTSWLSSIERLDTFQCYRTGLTVHHLLAVSLYTLELDSLKGSLDYSGWRADWALRLLFGDKTQPGKTNLCLCFFPAIIRFPQVGCLHPVFHPVVEAAALCIRYYYTLSRTTRNKLSYYSMQSLLLFD